MSRVVTRFAPSPTGLLHLGNVRTALLSWLYAHKHGGRFLLRFEDTDAERSEAEYIAAIRQDLLWLGLGWDGEVLFQSAHADRHREAMRKLDAKGLAYRCFCSENQLNLDRKLAVSRGLPPRYAGRCRQLSRDESEARAASEPFVWRLAIHDAAASGADVVVHDLLRGDVQFLLHDLDDPVVVRSDGSFTFLLPNAVDDALDGITHALRGDDHLTNTAYQVWLLKHLGFAPPVYLHHGLLLGSDGAKLSKRTGSHSVAQLRAAGLFPEALVQAMARLGHPNIPEELSGLDELAEAFDASRLSTSPVRWQDDAMWRWHTKILHATPPATLAPLLAPHLPPADAERLEAVAGLIVGNLERVEQAMEFGRLIDATVLDSVESYEVGREAGWDFFDGALKLWQQRSDADWKAWSAAVSTATGCKGKALFLPLRAALTGVLHGPDMGSVVAFLGREGVAERLEDMLARVAA
ncbi:MAG TPA: glutamate--tRNA ligase [Mariprofundaceae bacterium]|nr:glutamate--tRNA ligase [Mariprofundaceae bacterium]